MDYDPPSEYDAKCTQGTPGSTSTKPECLKPKSVSRFISNSVKQEEKCQNTPSSRQESFVGEKDCIFPFYYNEKKWDKCIVFTEEDFVYPAFRCPIYNLVAKYRKDGLNNYTIVGI